MTKKNALDQKKKTSRKASEEVKLKMGLGYHIN